ncbi:type II toxin-antitoxin system PemK/MazF family toxin [Gordonia sp. L191]|uniref:type II toxin-antitoxin system PemK/MazF family toxin n=1 Tax=Gordonia sp. L191 TaxID=2982699 RepID=UPI0024BFEE2D|nr:type II toxin-antitoxin system PemK/MazF family toxin [Gordonia sp. L191]WHU48881.1 type II toxin-antitoxin system PemK/MazF family toxin [Gordonia sp. L191]
MMGDRRMNRHAMRPTTEAARAISYSPDLDGDADPGEIVWTWVEFEEDPSQGKDRPVLVVGRDPAEDPAGEAGSTDVTSELVLALMLSSKDHHRDDDNWLSIGVGGWDSDHRESFIRLDRVLVVDADGIRREGAILDRARFDRVATELRDRFGWR